MTILRCSRPNTVDLQPQVPRLSSPRLKHELFKHVDNPIVELNDMPKARAPRGVVHKPSGCGALTRHTVDKDLDPRHSKRASLHGGQFRT
jgi:hypothetical protein